jgi:hypothetical protein
VAQKTRGPGQIAGGIHPKEGGAIALTFADDRTTTAQWSTVAAGKKCPLGRRSNVDSVKGAKGRRRMGFRLGFRYNTDEEDVMANYLYIFRGGDMARMSPQQMEENMKKWGAWMGQLSQTGNLKGGDPLGEVGRVVTGKKKAVTDGPFGETKDLVGGYLLVTAGSLDAATELARGCPIFESESGSVEVREVREMRM